jgi:hypothetical protein
MSVLAIYRATQIVLDRLPDDLHPSLMGFVGATRLDWRTCKQRESELIRRYYIWFEFLDYDAWDWISEYVEYPLFHEMKESYIPEIVRNLMEFEQAYAEFIWNRKICGTPDHIDDIYDYSTFIAWNKFDREYEEHEFDMFDTIQAWLAIMCE